MISLKLERVWGESQGRLPPGATTVALTDDPAVAYVFGNVDGRGLLRAVDPRTGETLREHALPLFKLRDRRVVASPVARDGTVLVAVGDGADAAVHSLALATGVTTRLFAARTSSLDRLDDGAVVLHTGVVVEAADGLRRRAQVEARWRSRDGRWSMVETPEGGGVRSVVTDASDGATYTLRLLRSQAVQSAFARDGSWLARLSTAVQQVELRALQRAGVTRRATRDYAERLPVTAQIAATRAEGLILIDPGDFGEGGAVVADDALSGFDAELHAGPGWTPQAPCVSPDGTRFGYVRNGVLHVVDLARGGELVACDLHTDRVNSIALSPDGACAVTGGADGVLTVWDVASHELRWRLEAGGSVRSVALAPDGTRAYAAVETRGDDRWWSNLRAWELAGASEITPAPMELSYGVALMMSPDGARAVVTNEVPGPRTPAWVDLARWRLRPYTWREVTRRERQSRSEFTSVALFSEDGTEVTVWWGHAHECWRSALDAATGDVVRVERLAQLPPHKRVSARGPTLRAWADAAGALSLARGAAKAPAATLQVGVEVTALALSRDERLLLAGTADGRVRVYRVEAPPER